MTNTRVLPRKIYDTPFEGMYAVCKFLTNELSGFVGPGWTLVEADDGSNRDVASTFGGLPSGNDWSTANSNIPSDGAWCVLESLDANNSNHFQLYLNLSSSVGVKARIFPFEDFSTGGSSTGGSDPTFPSVALGNSLSESVDFSMLPHLNRYSCVCDEGMAAIIRGPELFNDDTPAFLYVGEVNPFFQLAGDERCYVINSDPSIMYWDESVNSQRNFFRRISPSDNTTCLSFGMPLHAVIQNADVACTTARGNLLGQDVVWPVGVWFEDVGHVHYTGWLRNVFAVNKDLSLEGVLGASGSADYYYISSATQPSDFGRAPICFNWDGGTDYV